jgi:hypothetical protein
MKEFTDLLKKKASEQADQPSDPKSMEAKASAIKNLMQSLKEVMGGELSDGLKKVTVASNSPEGLAKGLDLAKKVVPTGMPGHELSEESGEEELGESPEFEASENESIEHGSDEERKIAELEKQLAELKAKKA